MKIDTACFVRSAFARDDLLRDQRPQIAFAGRSNVGKSSLLNRLAGRKALARVSSSPGRTRAINYFLINSRFFFVDLPGYGYAKTSRRERRRWADLVEGYLRGGVAGARRLVVQLIDANVGATPLDVEAVDYLRSLGSGPTLVATKIDRLPRGRRPQRLEEIRQALTPEDPRGPLPVSARTGEGIRELWRSFTAFLRNGRGRANGNEETSWPERKTR